MTVDQIFTSIGETLLIVIISSILAYLVGIPLGVLLHTSSKKGIKPMPKLNMTLSIIVNILRSIPCLIVIVLLMPVTRAIFGIGTGKWYTMIVPLFFSSFAYVARVVEQSLQEVDSGKIEAVKSLGATDTQIITKVLLPEARSSLIVGASVTMVAILGYTSFAYNIGAGGLISDIYIYYTNHTGDFASSWYFWLLIVIVVVIVQIIQESGLIIAKKIDKRKVAQ